MTQQRVIVSLLALLGVSLACACGTEEGLEGALYRGIVPLDGADHESLYRFDSEQSARFYLDRSAEGREPFELCFLWTREERELNFYGENLDGELIVANSYTLADDDQSFVGPFGGEPASFARADVDDLGSPELARRVAVDVAQEADAIRPRCAAAAEYLAGRPIASP